MLSFNRKFGLGAALRQRSIWSGSARSVYGLVSNQLHPYKPRGQTSPGSIALEGIAYNGSVYIGKGGGNTCYTSPDLVTFTARNPAPGNVFISAGSIGSRLLALTAYNGTYQIGSSTDNGATWGGLVGSGLTAPILLTAGGIGFLLMPGFGSSTFATISQAGVLTARNFPATAPGLWSGIASTGAAWVAISPVGGAAYSTNGGDFTVSASYAAEALKLPAFPVCIYALGSRFVAVAFSGSAFATIYSDDGGVTWQQGASYGGLAEGRSFASIHRDAVVLDGHLYISARAGGRALILSTHNGLAWRIHTDINASDSLPGLYKRAGVDSIVFNTTEGAGPLMETNVDAQELYYEL